MSNITEIQRLLNEKADLQAQINISAFDGSIEVKTVNDQKYIYVRKKMCIRDRNIRCLCPKCLNDYIHNPDYIVRRLDPFAKRKDRCDKCDGDGWDYVVTDRYSSKKEKRCKNV